MEIEITHFIIEFWGCESHLLADPDVIKQALFSAVERAKLTPLHTYLHTFKPNGITGVVVLMESHISIHTWPNYQYAALDLFTCGSREDALAAYLKLKEILCPRRVRRREVRRGLSR